MLDIFNNSNATTLYIPKRQKFPKPLSIELAGNADVAIGDFSALRYALAMFAFVS
jgi:hypothetical protein